MSLGWNAGVYFDKFYARVGLSYTQNGPFTAEGEGSVTVPDYLSKTGEQAKVDAKVTFDQPMPAVLQFWVNSDVTKKLTLGAGFEYQMWNACCGGPTNTLNPNGTEGGDLRIGVTDAQGNPIGPETTDLAITVAEEQWSPRRLWNSGNYAVNGGYRVNDLLWLGARAQYSQNAVPDYAVSATNLDYERAAGSRRLPLRPGPQVHRRPLLREVLHLRPDHHQLGVGHRQRRSALLPGDPVQGQHQRHLLRRWTSWSRFAAREDEGLPLGSFMRPTSARAARRRRAAGGLPASAGRGRRRRPQRTPAP